MKVDYTYEQLYYDEALTEKLLTEHDEVETTDGFIVKKASGVSGIIISHR